MFRRLYRQRRRFAVVTLLLTAALLVTLAQGWAPEGEALPLGNWITWLAVFLTSLIVTTGLILVTTYVLPGLRHGLETMTLTILALPAIQHAAATFGTDFGSYVWLVWILTFVALEHLIYGPHLDRLTFALPQRRTRFRTRAAPQVAWAALAPLAEHSGRHFYPGTRFETAEDGSLRAIYPLKGGQTYQVERFMPQQVEAPHLYAARFTPAEQSAGSGGLAGETVIEITPREDGGSDIAVSEARDAAPLRRHLQLWFDDELGDRADCMAARIDGRHDWSFFKHQFPRPRDGFTPVPA